MANETKNPMAKYVTPLNINGLHGRMLRIPPAGKLKREILVIYGHHASIERMYGVAEDISQYGGVTMPDLPGCGGMESFYKIGMKPTLDNMADYLAAFIKLRFKNKRLTIAGMSYGFVVVTRMLQRHPDIAKQVNLLISMVGFVHKDDFNFTRMRYIFYLGLTKIFSYRLPAMFFRNVCLHPFVIHTAYGRTRNAKKKLAGLSKSELKAALDFEVYLWHCNDVRTYMKTASSFLTLDNCRQLIGLPVWHISVENDRYFNNAVVEQHMRIVFTDFTEVRADLGNHAPSIIADAATAAPLIPKRIRQELAKVPS